jgi:cysteine-rich repeat protein
MKHHPRSHAVATLALTLLVLGGLAGHAEISSAVDCVGKPYGTPGCPTRPAASSASSGAPNQCGNAILDDGEECDRGRFNGKTDCSTECRVLFCGDAVISRDLGEECEPQTEEVYVQDEQGNLTTEIRFTEGPQCGWYCQPPVCDDDGNCHGGCKLKYSGSCAVSSSSGPNQSLATSSTSSVETHAAASASSTSVTGSAGSVSSVAASSAPTVTVPPSTAICGDGLVQNPEECDDGNRNPLDACTNDCKKPMCGDGIVQAPEECDDANTQDLDACSSTCKRARCGDGVVQSALNEQCDDGNTIPTDSCSNDCRLPSCGDGIKQPGEECDEGLKNSDTAPDSCRRDCRLPRCGDAVTDNGEQCDAGARNSANDPNACRPQCRLAYCGDGVLDSNEQCDDGNRNDSDGCTKECRRSVCGDGEVQTPEECDAGPLNSNTKADACRVSCKLPRCGDGVIDTNEECDGGDNCRSTCVLRAPQSSSSAQTSSGAGAGVIGSVDFNGPVMAIALGGAAAVGIGILGFVFRKRLGGLFKLKSLKSIDDIPLDQIEMPWHKW